MPPWKSLVLSKVTISNGFSHLRSKISVFAVHPKITRLKNVMLSKIEGEELFLKTYKITTRDLSLWAMSNHHHQNLNNLLLPDLAPILTLVLEADKVITTI